MQLFNDSSERFPTLDSEVVKRRGARKLYFVHDGRNAWHSTWVQRYHDGCMHSSLQSAKRYAERQRVQGSVFYVHELPAVLLAGESLVLAVTEINTDHVLVGYSPNTPLPPHATFNPTGNAIVVGKPLWEAYHSFDRSDGFYWRPQSQRQGQVVRVLAHARLSDFESAGRGQMRTFVSSSVGAAYFLSWTQTTRRLETKHVHRIARSRLRRAPMIEDLQQWQELLRKSLS